MQAQPVTLKTLPPELVDGWKTKDGLMRVEALPKGDPNDNEVCASLPMRFWRPSRMRSADRSRFSNPATPS